MNKLSKKISKVIGKDKKEKTIINFELDNNKGITPKDESELNLLLNKLDTNQITEISNELKYMKSTFQDPDLNTFSRKSIFGALS